MVLASFRSCTFAKKFSLFGEFAPPSSWRCPGAPALVREHAGPPSSPAHGRSQALPEANHTTFDLDAFFLRARRSERLELKWRLRAIGRSSARCWRTGPRRAYPGMRRGFRPSSAPSLPHHELSFLIGEWRPGEQPPANTPPPHPTPPHRSNPKDRQEQALARVWRTWGPHMLLLGS